MLSMPDPREWEEHRTRAGDLRRLDEVAGPPSYELTGYRRSGISALEAQRRASHGSLCDRSRWKEIPGLHSFGGWTDHRRTALRLEAYLGLAPGESSSSERQQRLSITKAGPSTVRWVLIQSAWALRVRCRKPGARQLQLWAAEIEKRRGKRIATVALARRLAGILYALWRDGTQFDPAH